MWALIPILGPIFSFFSGIFSKFEDTQVAKYTVDGQVISTEVKASADTTIAFKDDPGVRLARDLVLFPISLWTALIIWDKIVDIRFPWLVWGVSPLGENTGIAFLPYAAMIFLFGLVAMTPWKRK